MSDFFNTRRAKASQKLRKCDECRHPINIGEPYSAHYCKCEGEFYTIIAHPECEAWANAVMCTDEGRAPICQSDPSDEYELEEAVLANPPSDLVRSRLPARWLAAVDAILAKAEAA